MPRSWFARGSLELAPLLLNKVLVVDGCSGRIVEVEAYRPDDPASHSFRGQTPRNATMFGPPGHLYVYFTYGMHFCANVVCGTEGDAQAVLLRGIEPLTGVEAMRARRGSVAERDLTNGPGKLCQAFAIARDDDGADVVPYPRRPGQRMAIVDDGTPPPDAPGVSARIGISVAVDRPWRWYVPGNPGVSKAKPPPIVLRTNAVAVRPPASPEREAAGVRRG